MESESEESERFHFFRFRLRLRRLRCSENKIVGVEKSNQSQGPEVIIVIGLFFSFWLRLRQCNFHEIVSGRIISRIGVLLSTPSVLFPLDCIALRFWLRLRLRLRCLCKPALNFICHLQCQVIKHVQGQIQGCPEVNLTLPLYWKFIYTYGGDETLCWLLLITKHPFLRPWIHPYWVNYK